MTPKKKAPSTIKVGKRTYDKAYVGPFSKTEAYKHAASIRKRGLASRARKFGNEWHVYAGDFYTEKAYKRAVKRGR